MTFAELYAEVQSNLGSRSDLTASIAGEFVNRAYLRITNVFQFYELDETDTSKATVDGTSTVAIPTSAREIISVKITGDTEYEITPMEIGWYERQDTTDDNRSTPQHYVRYGSNLLLWPTPDDAYSLRIRYRKDPAVLTGVVEPVIPSQWHEAIAALATSMAANRFGLVEKMQEWKNEYLGLVSGVQEDATKDSRHRIGQIRMVRTRKATRLGYPDPDYAESP